MDIQVSGLLAKGKGCSLPLPELVLKHEFQMETQGKKEKRKTFWGDKGLYNTDCILHHNSNLGDVFVPVFLSLHHEPLCSFLEGVVPIINTQSSTLLKEKLPSPSMP